jgi:tRNA-specific adenosine deaminase 1
MDPIYLESVTVHQMFDLEALERALYGRLSNLPGKYLETPFFKFDLYILLYIEYSFTALESPYRLNQPRILRTDQQYSSSKQALETKVPSSDVITCNTGKDILLFFCVTSMRKTEKVSNVIIAMTWVLGMPKCEVIVNGRRQGAPRPKNGQHDLKSRYDIPSFLYQIERVFVLTYF